MNLASLVRAALKTADTVTKSLQVDVTFEGWIGDDGFGSQTWAAPVTLKAIVELKERLRTVTSTGQIVMTKAQITLLQPVPNTAPNVGEQRIQPIDPRDIFTLPDGTTGPIIDVEGMFDPGTNAPYFAQVWLGSSKDQ